MDLNRPFDSRHPDEATQAASVAAAIDAMLSPHFPGWDGATVREAFVHAADAYSGRVPGFLPCDTPYHDLRHILETALAMARLIEGWERRNGARDSLGAPIAATGVILALLHDVGLLREWHEGHLTGASLTVGHEARGARYAQRYLSGTPLRGEASLSYLIDATRLGCRVEDLCDDPRHLLLARMLATADLVAQLADREYLEKCRDFLYVEFIAVGWARGPDGRNPNAPYASPEDLLSKTPAFCREQVLGRLDDALGGVHHLFSAHFGGDDPYMAAMQRNLGYLEGMIADGDYSRLRRTPTALLSDRVA